MKNLQSDGVGSPKCPKPPPKLSLAPRGRHGVAWPCLAPSKVPGEVGWSQDTCWLGDEFITVSYAVKVQDGFNFFVSSFRVYYYSLLWNIQSVLFERLKAPESKVPGIRHHASHGYMQDTKPGMLGPNDFSRRLQALPLFEPLARCRCECSGSPFQAPELWHAMACYGWWLCQGKPPGYLHPECEWRCIEMQRI